MHFRVLRRVQNPPPSALTSQLPTHSGTRLFRSSQQQPGRSMAAKHWRSLAIYICPPISSQTPPYRLSPKGRLVIARERPVHARAISRRVAMHMNTMRLQDAHQGVALMRSQAPRWCTSRLSPPCISATAGPLGPFRASRRTKSHSAAVFCRPRQCTSTKHRIRAAPASHGLDACISHRSVLAR